MASTRVDLPEPISPVRSDVLPPNSKGQTAPSKVPQLYTSSRRMR